MCNILSLDNVYLLQLAAEKFEEGERALQEAKRVETDHEARLRNIHSQTERLRQQEQRILQVSVRQPYSSDLAFYTNILITRIVTVHQLFFIQERMRSSHLQKDTEMSRQDAPISSFAQITPSLPGEVLSS